MQFSMRLLVILVFLFSFLSFHCSEDGESTGSPSSSDDAEHNGDGDDAANSIPFFDYGPETITTSICDIDCTPTGKQEFSYDSEGRLTSHVHYEYLDGEWQVWWILEYTYDGNTMKISDTYEGEPRGGSEYEFDADGRLISSLYDDGTFHSTIYVYNDKGWLIREEESSRHSDDEEWLLDEITSYEYDVSGRLVLKIRESVDSTVGYRYEFIYDDLGRLLTKTQYETRDGVEWSVMSLKNAVYSPEDLIESYTVQSPVDEALEQTMGAEIIYSANQRIDYITWTARTGNEVDGYSTDEYLDEFVYTDAGSSLTWTMRDPPLIDDIAGFYGRTPVNLYETD